MKRFIKKINDDEQIIVRSLKQPTVIKADINNNQITYTIEKELGIELVGNTKVKIVVDDEDNFVDNVNVQYLFDASNNVNGAKLSFDTLLDNGTYYINVYYDNVPDEYGYVVICSDGELDH